jgi:hypothetical protein
MVSLFPISTLMEVMPGHRTSRDANAVPVLAPDVYIMQRTRTTTSSACYFSPQSMSQAVRLLCFRRFPDADHAFL